MEAWQPDAFYTLLVWNTEGPVGRAKGGFTCLFKLWLTTLKILCRDENLLGAKTIVIARIHGRIHCQERGHCTVLSG
jgi:hypothetical protein